eukprot:s2761_g17.t1
MRTSGYIASGPLKHTCTDILLHLRPTPHELIARWLAHLGDVKNASLMQPISAGCEIKILGSSSTAEATLVRQKERISLCCGGRLSGCFRFWLVLKSEGHRCSSGRRSKT